ncbi:MAG: DUF1343 domain-containing protein [Deferrisomatales bacterium]
MVAVGLERLGETLARGAGKGVRWGLLYNAASVDRHLRSSRDVVAQALGVGKKGGLAALFGPQHGVDADVQDNMVESPHGVDAKLGVPVWSLYSKTRKPTPEMLEGIDALLVDLQDVGARVYTFAWTLRLAMEACGEADVRVVVLDRPNPLGGAAEGNRLRAEWASFVGLEPVPMRHGLTLGELARWFRDCRGVACDLEVVPMAGWRRSMRWSGTGRPWVLPSPNMPTPDTALVYPGTVLLEGTTASEGRGTTRPFEIFGAPWVDPEALAEELNRLGLPGVVFRPLVFVPAFQKWAGRPCGGTQIHVTDPARFRPYATGLRILSTLWRTGCDRGFGWRAPPYEYETRRLPIHLLLGDVGVRRALEGEADLEELEAGWEADLEAWREEVAPVLLYR